MIGHSFGGLFTQLVLGRGLGRRGVALGTGAPKGVLKLQDGWEEVADFVLSWAVEHADAAAPPA